MRKGLIIGIIVLAVVAAIVSTRKKSNPSLQTVRLCISRNYTNALFAVAEEKGYFRRHGLNIVFGIENLGKVCAEKMNKKYDLAVAYNTPILARLNQGDDLVIVSEIHRSSRNTSILISKGDEEFQPRQLEGKRLALIPGTNGEFLLKLYCMAHAIRCDAIRKEPISLADIPKVMENPRVDGIVIWQPFLNNLMKLYPRRFEVLNSTFYTEFSVLVGKRKYVDEHPDLVERVLRALNDAQIEFAKNPTESQETTYRRLNYSQNERSNSDWASVRIGLGLSSVFKSMLEIEYDLAKTRPVVDNVDEISSRFDPQFLNSLGLTTYQ